MALSIEDWLGYLLLLGRGGMVTVKLTIASCAIGFSLALVIGLCRLSRFAAIRWATTAYVEFFRSTSIYVQLFWVYYVLPLVGVNLSAIEAGILGLSLNTAAYGSELVRAAVQTVPREQHEAGIALNLTRWQRLRHVTLPQSFVVMLPLFNNLSIEVMKLTAIVSLITITELTFQAQIIRVQTGSTAIPYLASLAFYFLFASLIAFGFRTLERRFARGHEGVRG